MQNFIVIQCVICVLRFCRNGAFFYYMGDFVPYITIPLREDGTAEGGEDYMMDKDIFVKLLQERQFKAVRSILNVMNAVDIAALLSELDDKELALAFRLIPKEAAADVFANMNNSLQSYLVEMFTEKELKELLDDLYMDDTVDMLEELPASLVIRILDSVSQSKRDMINILLNYPDDSAGSIMTTEYVALRQYMTVAESMAHIKRTGIHKETIYTCYVTDKKICLAL